MKGDKMADGQQKKGIWKKKKKGVRKMIAGNSECIMQKKKKGGMKNKREKQDTLTHGSFPSVEMV